MTPLSVQRLAPPVAPTCFDVLPSSGMSVLSAQCSPSDILRNVSALSGVFRKEWEGEQFGVFQHDSKGFGHASWRQEVSIELETSHRECHNSVRSATHPRAEQHRDMSRDKP